MSLAMELFQHERERGAARNQERDFQFEHRLMGFADPGMDSPGGLLVPVERVIDGPAALVEVRGRIHQRQLTRLRCARLEKQHLKLAQVQVAVVLPARTLPRQ